VIDRLPFGIAAGPGEIAGVKHLVARREVRHALTDRLHHARRVPAEDARRIVRPFAERRADLGVHRIHRDGLHAHQQVLVAGFGFSGFEFHQTCRIVHWQKFPRSDRFHG
jgi:hypothetical protein